MYISLVYIIMLIRLLAVPWLGFATPLATFKDDYDEPSTSTTSYIYTPSHLRRPRRPARHAGQHERRVRERARGAGPAGPGRRRGAGPRAAAGLARRHRVAVRERARRAGPRLGRRRAAAEARPRGEQRRRGVAREAHLRDVLGLEVVDAGEVDLGVPQELLGRRVEGAADGRERLDEPRRAVGRRPGGRGRARRPREEE